MKKVSLCAFSARYSHSNMALHCLSNAVPFDLQIIELSINDNLAQSIEIIAETQPDVVGFSCYIWSIDTVLKAASSIKKILPDCFIILGGPQVSFDSESLMKQHSFIDMIIRGEGEIPFAHFMNCINHNTSILDTPSSCIRQGSKIITTPDAPPASLDELPFIYDDLSVFKNKMLYYETSRGCPYKCAYCMSADENTRFLSLDRVKKELEFFLKANVKRVKLVDRTFNYPAKRAYDIFNMLICLSEEYPLSATNFHFEISACLLTDDILELLSTAKPGLIQLEIGIQSTNKQTLKAINRNHDLDKLFASTKKLCKMNNIHVHTDLIAGLPYEDYKSFSKSFDDVYSLGAQQLQLGFLKVLKGSPIYDMTAQYGIEYTEYPPYEVLKTHVLSFRELRVLHNIETLVDIMHNSGTFAKTLPFLIGDSAFSFFERFAAFAIAHSYFERPQPRHRLFELVYSFSGKNEKVKEALVFDWLMIQRPGKWPNGLLPIQPSKEKTREFFSNKNNLPHYAHLSAGNISNRCFICTFSKLFDSQTTMLFDYGDKGKALVSKIEL